MVFVLINGEKYFFYNIIDIDDNSYNNKHKLGTKVKKKMKFANLNVNII